MTYSIINNANYNSIEVLFEGKPSEAIREALKALRFRWHNVRRVWYGYADEQTTRAAIEAAENGANVEQIAPNRTAVKKSEPRLASLWDRCDVSELPAYGTDNELKRSIRAEASATGASYDKTVAAYIRKHLRERFPECRFSVTSGGAGYLNAVNISIKSSPYGRELVKGDPSAWSDRDRWDYWENSPELDAVLNYCTKLYNAFDADDGDIYADYGAHHDLYGSVDIEYGYTQTEPTEAERASAADFAQRKAEADAAEEARKAAEWAEREKQIEQERAEAEKLEKIRAEQCAEIAAHVGVVDLPETEQIAVVGLLEGCGKECSLEEVRESVAEQERRTDAVITRKVNFSDARIFEHFCNSFLEDFEFLEGKGGTRTEDPRVNEENYMQLNAEQCEAVKWYACDCIGVYFNGEFQFVIDPEGYRFARYVLVPDEYTDSYKAPEKLDEWRAAGESRPAFYIPAPVAEQIKRIELEPGDDITIVTLDPWMMTAGAKRGKLNSATPQAYAQHSDAVQIVYTPEGKRKTVTEYIYKAKEALIYRGSLPDVPHHLKYTDVGGNLQRVNFAGEGARDFLIRCIEYYKALGYEPAVDTIQR